MKIGQSVTHVGPDGSERLAEITGLVEHGPSRFWVLDLDGIVVPHESDKADGGYWRLGEPQEPQAKRRKKDPAPSTPAAE
jgi:hypothetical protein